MSAPLPKTVDFPSVGTVCRLGLASRGNTDLPADAVHEAIERGVNYLNWCGTENGMRRAIAELGSRRNDVRIAIQLESRSAEVARREFEQICEELGTDVIDVVTYYYVEDREDWDRIHASDGAAGYLEMLKSEGRVKSIGLTSHQRPLAASFIQDSDHLDMLMLRYNAAHRGAEDDVFPLTHGRLPVVSFTALRWGALLRPTPTDPPDFTIPPATDWYRFALAHPAVSVTLMAPHDADELRQNLTLLDEWHALSEERHAELAAHGDRVREHAGRFP